ncbi:MAG TPA: hypothetical protein VMZ53_17420 [Kofleriaceae bacterium]|nr:hypothetical protein [Kofleriaceae bacterium]
MRIAIVGAVLAIVVALALVFTNTGRAPAPPVDPQHQAAAIQVARCDAAMSKLDAELKTSKAASALATRIEVCTKARAAVERAQTNKPSTQLEVALARVNKHLARLNEGMGSAAPAPSPTAGSAGSN